MYLSRQLYEEALHVQFYLTLLDTYLPEPEARAKAFTAMKHPAIRHKAEFATDGWIRSIRLIESKPRRSGRHFLLNLICFATCIEGLFFSALLLMSLFALSWLLHGLASGTNGCFATKAGIWRSLSK